MFLFSSKTLSLVDIKLAHLLYTVHCALQKVQHRSLKGNNNKECAFFAARANRDETVYT